ncbi:NADH dehydrogenase [Caballeronia hypogeia]|uniref:NADH dehydrogenase n=1 Tax=Caballeronia hypogeia TaxID=1777140 RepID=A0A158D707_9BURK|nr:NAD(P)/FAD-dependent oxidoreductase [Caballeronia hypogeia]SAK90110.1 NADH dehydrogenase [Caballeronia hypogeia]
MHRIVIVGGGAGGLELATRLGDSLGRTRRAQVTLVDCRPTHVWKPLLHEVATGSLDIQVHQIEYAAQARWHHFEFVHGALDGLDRGAKHLHIAPPAESEHMMPTRTVEYDTLVLALGSRTHFFGVPGAAEHSIALDTVEQAERLRQRLLQACVRHSGRHGEGSRTAANVAIIGGGATGVELAAELRRMEIELRRFGLHSSARDSDIRVTLIEAGPRVLPALPPEVSATTEALLARLNIEVSVGDPVTDVSPHALTTRSGRAIPVDLTIWAAGIKAPDCLAALDGLPVNRINQLKVTRTLRSEADDNVFALGDCASCSWTDGKMVPPRAQAAHQQALFLAKALKSRVAGRPIGEFTYSDYGSLVSLGHVSAVGSLPGALGKNLIVRGFMAKLMYAALYRKHLAAVSGLRRSLASLAMHALRRVTTPRVKLH